VGGGGGEGCRGYEKRNLEMSPTSKKKRGSESEERSPFFASPTTWYVNEKGTKEKVEREPRCTRVGKSPTSIEGETAQRKDIDKKDDKVRSTKDGVLNRRLEVEGEPTEAISWPGEGKRGKGKTCRDLQHWGKKKLREGKRGREIRSRKNNVV